MAKTVDIDKLKELRDKVNTQISELVAKQRKERHTLAGKRLEALYQKNPDAMDIATVKDICETFFTKPTMKKNKEKKETTAR